MTNTAPKWSDWYNTKAFPQRELETYDGMVLDRETADADHLNALEAKVARYEAALTRIANHCDARHPDWVQDHIGIAKIAAVALNPDVKQP